MESLGAAGESSGLLPPEAADVETEPAAQLRQVGLGLGLGLVLGLGIGLDWRRVPCRPTRWAHLRERG